MVLGMLRGALTPLAMVTTATDAADALLKAVDDPPDLLVSDYRMPGMDGRQLVEKLRSRPRTAEAAVILVATKTDISEKLSTPDLPVDDFVEKPFFLQGSHATHQAGDRQDRAGKNGQDRSLRRSAARQPVADECHRPGAVARNGPQELFPHPDQQERQVRTVLQRRPGHARHVRLAGRGSGRIQGSALDGWKLRGQFRRQDAPSKPPS